jgi:3-hydroxyacyl-CoA dehydrogenase
MIKNLNLDESQLQHKISIKKRVPGSFANRRSGKDTEMAETIETVGVVGLGVMGFDIAFLYAMKGHRTIVYDAAKPAMDSLAARSERAIERLRRRDRIGKDEVENVKSGLRPAADIREVARTDLITEAVSETRNVKTAVYRALTDAGFDGILTTNTSSLTHASLLSSGVFEGARFASTHFFNPVLYTRMVEVVQGEMRNNLFSTTLGFLENLGRTPVRTHDISGFVSNSILMYHAVAALWLLEHGASIEAVDQTAQELGLLPPFISFDSWKPSIVDDVTRVMYELRGDAFLRSSPSLVVLARLNPRFYLDQKPNRQVYTCLGREPAGLDQELIRRVLTVSIRVAAARIVELGEDPGTVDHIAVNGLRIPRGPLVDIDTAGPAAVVQDAAEVNAQLGETRLAVPDLLASMAEQGQRFFSDGGRPNAWVENYVEQKAS